MCVTVPCSISAQKAYRSQAQFSDVELFLRESPDGGHRLRRERVHGWQPCFSWKTVGTLKWPCYRNHKTWHFRISKRFYTALNRYCESNRFLMRTKLARPILRIQNRCTCHLVFESLTGPLCVSLGADEPDDKMSSYIPLTGHFFSISPLNRGDKLNNCH